MVSVRLFGPRIYVGPHSGLTVDRPILPFVPQTVTFTCQTILIVTADHTRRSTDGYSSQHLIDHPAPAHVRSRSRQWFRMSSLSHRVLGASARNRRRADAAECGERVTTYSVRQSGGGDGGRVSDEAAKPPPRN